MMASHGFVELQDASDGTLRRILALSCRWSRDKRIYVWPVGVSRERLDGLLRSTMAEHGGRVAAVKILPPEDRAHATLLAQTAAFCLLSSSTLAPCIGQEQVAVFFPSWNATNAPVVWESLTGD